MTALPRTNFELFACHQDLCIRNDGGRQAVLQPVSFRDRIKETRSQTQNIHKISCKNKDEVR